MQVSQTEFPGVLIVEPTVFSDNRGFFMESYNRQVFEQHGIHADFMQDNHARSSGVGVLRGFHFQAPPMAQAKLVWVTRGAVVDVVVDIRVGSPTYGQWGQLKLSAENKLRLFIPAGFAHAYMTLSEETEFIYKVDAPYSPADEGGIRWDDPDLAVNWPVKNPILSNKDKALGTLAKLSSPFSYSG
ncbi:MAG: dTDP-4-dehydrorhamnose 3,5-epimerase [Proteobacteria bacterium]|nr:dTDP-4-dehydrorhamnose 3,5-epimerase [Pseudomonadota bacterium]MBU1611621.1 dTDP-4-dehydrorhamnose 3,5-epimerase [Pseudomonadota bacterium]